MRKTITDATIRKMVPPSVDAKQAYVIDWDTRVRGFGVRLTANGIASFILVYRAHGRQRKMTIGRYGAAPDLSVEAARKKAEQLLGRVRDDKDPMAEKQKLREEATLGKLLDAYLASGDFAKLRAKTQESYTGMIEKTIRPKLGRLRLSAISISDIDKLHTSMEATPYAANRVRGVLSRVFSYGIDDKNAVTRKSRWGIVDNPVESVKRYDEEKRECWLSTDEMKRFDDALNQYHDQNAANALRLLLLTGSRMNEVLKAHWEHFDLERSQWTKPSHHVKQKKIEHIPLIPEAVKLLLAMKPVNARGPIFLGRAGKDGKRKARVGIKRPWQQACRAAGLVEVVEIAGKRKDKKTGKPKMLKRYKPTVRIHDLRHNYASYLISHNVPLATVGKLLGHTRPETTMRYAHLQDQAMRNGANVFGEILESIRE